MTEVPSLAELYQDPNIQYGTSCWKDAWPKSIEGLIETIGPLGHISTQAVLTEQLDGLDEISDVRKAAATLLGGLPTKALLDTYGQGATAWSLGNDEITHRAKEHTEELDMLGFNGPILWQAALLCRIASQTPKSTEVLAQMTVMETVLGNGLDKIDLPALLRQSALPGVAISDKRACDYGFVRLASEFRDYSYGGRVFDWRGKEAVEESGLLYDLWLDTPVGFALTYKGHPQAVAGVYAKGEDELFIRQLQGSRGTKYEDIEERGKTVRKVTGYKPPRGLAPLDWRKFLVGASAEIARQLKFSSVGIVRGDDVPHYSRCHISFEDARKAYDEQAVRLDFNRAEDNNWSKPLDQF